MTQLTVIREGLGLRQASSVEIKAITSIAISAVVRIPEWYIFGDILPQQSGHVRPKTTILIRQHENWAPRFIHYRIGSLTATTAPQTRARLGSFITRGARRQNLATPQDIPTIQHWMREVGQTDGPLGWQ